MSTKIAYISGPISGLENGNEDKFRKAQVQLEKEGYVVMNPHELGKDLYAKWSKTPIRTKEQEQEMWQEFMKEDIKFLTLAEAVFLLDNWETSRGATMEIFIAQKLGIPIYYMSNYQPFNMSFQLLKMPKQ